MESFEGFFFNPFRLGVSDVSIGGFFWEKLLVFSEETGKSTMTTINLKTSKGTVFRLLISKDLNINKAV